MANLKFSGFTANAAVDQADSFLVGFDTDGGGLNPTNNKWTFPQIATGLAAVTATPYSIYAADGTIGSGRVATVTDTLTFNNSSNQNILKISNEVCIGQIAVAGGNTTVAIGLDSRATGGSTTAVGSYARATNGNSSAFGHNAQTSKVGALVIGYYSRSLGDYGVSVGYACGAANGTAANVINIGKQAKGEGANSITFASNGSSTAPTTANAFGVYMTSNTTPDFEVVGSGMSTLNTNLTVKGTDDLVGTTGLLVENNSGDDLFFIKNDGTFALGKGAISTGSNTSTVIGRDANSAHQFTTNVGYGATTGGNYQVAIGSGSETSGSFAIAIGSNDTVTSGNKSITLNSTSGTGTTTNSSNETFAVYMTSKATPDLEVVGSGTSTLRTNLNVTGNMEVDGQAWGDLYDGGTIADGATFTPDWNNGNVQKIVIATGAAITIANGSNLNNGATYILIIEQAGAGGTVTWGGKYQWPAATPPVLSSGAAKADVITMLPYNSASILSSSTLDFLTA